MNFNSIKVQLELSVQFGESEVLGFQFHKGTIRTDVSTAEKVYDANFNSIKVQLEQNNLVHFTVLLLHFNSIKVQLELFSRKFLLSCSRYFNSIKVQLELE